LGFEVLSIYAMRNSASTFFKGILMACSECAAARMHPMSGLFDPACLYCGARLIQRIGKLAIAQSDATARRRVALADWLTFGHDEARIRALVKGPLAIEPIKNPEEKA